VLEAQDGAEALEIGRSGKDVHLLLTDVVMPLLDGVELARKWRELRPAARVLFMTGLAKESWPEGAVIQKPFVPDDLAERVRAALQ